jgi:hypothetical protein
VRLSDLEPGDCFSFSDQAVVWLKTRKERTSPVSREIKTLCVILVTGDYFYLSGSTEVVEQASKVH